jgi:twitching motility protein PilU
VLSTLHSTNATQSIERGLNFFSREYQQQVLMQLSYHLKAIISQRLIPSESRNRIPVLEVLINTAFVQELLQKGELGQMKKVMESGRQEGDSGDGFSKSWIGNPLN